jgi:hypothetical protein
MVPKLEDNVINKVKGYRNKKRILSGFVQDSILLSLCYAD